MFWISALFRQFLQHYTTYLHIYFTVKMLLRLLSMLFFICLLLKSVFSMFWSHGIWLSRQKTEENSFFCIFLILSHFLILVSQEIHEYRKQGPNPSSKTGTFYKKIDFKQGFSIMHAGPSEEKSKKKTRRGLFSGSLLFYLMRQLFKENVIVIPGGHGLVSQKYR